MYRSNRPATTRALLRLQVPINASGAAALSARLFLHRFLNAVLTMSRAAVIAANRVRSNPFVTATIVTGCGPAAPTRPYLAKRSGRASKA